MVCFITLILNSIFFGAAVILACFSRKERITALVTAFLALVAGLNSGIRVWEWLP